MTRFKKTTDSNHGGPVAPNVLNQNFATDGSNQKWGVLRAACFQHDISYVWTTEGQLYLAIVIDLFSRKIVGWAMSNRMKRSLELSALQRAITLRRSPPGLIHHSDCGRQYCSDDYRRLVAASGFIASMSGHGNWYDVLAKRAGRDAMVETVFKTIKSECILHTAFRSREQACNAIGLYIEGFYNPPRRHSSLGYKNPAAFETDFKIKGQTEKMALH